MCVEEMFMTKEELLKRLQSIDRQVVTRSWITIGGDLGELMDEIRKEINQESLPTSNVDKAAKEYASTQLGNKHDVYFSINVERFKAFKAGAEWMANQGETLYDTINVDGKNQRWLGENLLQGDYDAGQAVIVQIRKV